MRLDSLIYAPPFNYSGGDSLTFQYHAFRKSRGILSRKPRRSASSRSPTRRRSPFRRKPAFYQPGLPVPVNINVALTDTDGSEFLGFVVLDSVPAGVVPSAGQQSAGVIRKRISCCRAS